MPLSETQVRILDYMTLAGWSSGGEVAEWTGMSGRTTRHALMGLLRRGLVVHSDHVSDTWLATPRAVRVVAGQDGRMV